MIKNKTIFVAHNWSDASIAQQSKALGLALSQYNTVCFLSAKKNGHHGKEINERLTVYEWPGKRPTGIKDALFALRLFKKYKPDIIITNFAANNIMLIISFLSGVKARMCYHHTLVDQIIADKGMLSLKDRLYIFRKSVLYKLATHLLPCSSAAKKDLIDNYHIAQTKAFIFPNALEDRKIQNKSANNKTIGFIGRLDYSKGVDILISAFGQVRLSYADAKLVIVGNGKQENILRAQASEFKDITFTGNVSYKEVFTLLQTFTCLVIPSRTDNLPTVILEAFSSHTPVVASNTGGIPDMIEDGYNGLLFEKENTRMLADRLVSLLNNKEERARLAANARKIFLKNYCVDTLPLRFEQLLASTHYL